MNSKDKGKRGEREAATILSKIYNKLFVRSAQVSGRLLADVVCLDNNGNVCTTGFHFEVKRDERLNLLEAINQAKRDAKPGELPVVLHKKNRSEWLITFELEDLQKFVDYSNKLGMTN